LVCLQMSLRRERIGGALAATAQLRVARAEQLLRKLEHQRLVALRTEDLHDHPEWIEQCHVAREIAASRRGGHVVHGLLGELTNLRFQTFEILGHEP